MHVFWLQITVFLFISAYEYIDVLNGGAIANTDLISDETLLAAPLSTSRVNILNGKFVRKLLFFCFDWQIR